MGKGISYIKNIYEERPGEHFKKKGEPWTVVLIGRVLGTPIARFFARLNIHPNIITIFTMPFAFLAGICFYFNALLLGALLYFFSYILDCADGTLARMTNTSSRYGERLDYYTDIINNIPMYLGLWYVLYFVSGQWLIGGLIIFAHYCIMVFGYVFLTKLKYTTFSPLFCSYYMAADEGFLMFFFAPIIEVFIPGSFYVVFPVLVFLQLVSYCILFVTQKERPNVIKNIRSMLKLQ